MLSVPKVRTAAVLLLSVTFPFPLSCDTNCATPFTSSVAVFPSEKAVPAGKMFAVANISRPSVTFNPLNPMPVASRRIPPAPVLASEPLMTGEEIKRARGARPVAFTVKVPPLALRNPPKLRTGSNPNTSF